jgi:hypothetical protein
MPEIIGARSLYARELACVRLAICRSCAACHPQCGQASRELLRMMKVAGREQQSFTVHTSVARPWAIAGGVSLEADRERLRFPPRAQAAEDYLPLARA